MKKTTIVEFQYPGIIGVIDVNEKNVASLRLMMQSYIDAGACTYVPAASFMIVGNEDLNNLRAALNKVFSQNEPQT